jgi:hypothetical protein
MIAAVAAGRGETLSISTLPPVVTEQGVQILVALTAYFVLAGLPDQTPILIYDIQLLFYASSC